MAITVTVTPGKVLSSTEAIDNDKLNQLGQPSFVITGTVATTDIANGAVTAAKTTVDASNFATSAFAAGVYTLTFSPATAPTSLVNGLEVCFKAQLDCTGATQINVGVGGNLSLLKQKTEPLVVGDIIANQMVLCRYDATAGVWQMQSQLSMPETWRATTAGSSPNFTATLTPPNAANSVTLAGIAGRPIILKMHADGAGSDNLQLTVGTAAALVSKSMRKNFNQLTVFGDLKQNQEAIVVYDATTDTFQLANPVNFPQAGIVADSRNSVVTWVSTSSVTAAADGIVLAHRTNGTLLAVAAYSRTLVATNNGLDGLDVGTFPGSATAAWHYIWIISDGTNTRGLFSLQNAIGSITFPSGYVYGALVGMVYNVTIASSSFQRIYILGRSAWSNTIPVITTATAGTLAYKAFSSDAAVQAAFRTAVPPVAKTASGYMGNTTTGANRGIQLAADALGLGGVLGPIGGVSNGAIDGYAQAGYFSVPIFTSQDLFWKVNDVASTFQLGVTGFTF